MVCHKTARRPRRLTKFKLTAVALVPQGANQQAHGLLYKTASPAQAAPLPVRKEQPSMPALAALAALATQRVAKTTGLTLASARAAVCTERPELYARSIDECRMRQEVAGERKDVQDQ